jgi:uncharacterized protein YgbK (DUF1537 family)
MSIVSEAALYRKIPAFSTNTDIEGLLCAEGKRRDKVVVVLDDDPTGIQTVHDVYVYTDWSYQALLEAFAEECCFFIHTNTRAMTEDEAAEVNRAVMTNCILASRKTGRDFSVISRGDSTLRGHYPLETSVLREVYEAATKQEIHGEVLAPCFFEGGRYTYNNIHYVKEGGDFIPVGETEYAGDSVFGFKSSNLGEYIEEKTKGQWKTREVATVPLALMRKGDTEEILRILLSVGGFRKVVVNAMGYDDLRVFLIACLEAERAGRRFIYRTAASFVKVYCMIEDRALLRAEDIHGMNKGGNAVLTVVGSHIRKSSEQLDFLLRCEGVCGIELNVERVLKDEPARQEEIERASRAIDLAFESSVNPVLFTSRKLVRAFGPDGRDNLGIARAVSETLVEIVKKTQKKASCIIAKGGTTASDILVKGLGVKRARVAGQVLPGVPLLCLPAIKGDRYITYIIYPGNVGDRESLAGVYKTVA